MRGRIPLLLAATPASAVGKLSAAAAHVDSFGGVLPALVPAATAPSGTTAGRYFGDQAPRGGTYRYRLGTDCSLAGAGS